MNRSEACITVKRVVKAEVVLEYDMGNGQRTRRTYELDPTSFQINEHQQYEKIYDCGESDELAEIKKVGNPTVMVAGELIGGSNRPFSQVSLTELDVCISKIADTVTFRFVWKDKQVARYDLLEGVLATENIKQRIDIMVDKAFYAILDLGEPIQRGQVYAALEREISIRGGLVEQAVPVVVGKE